MLITKMEAIILCAGYATRLYPLTRNKPKPLLEINTKPIIEHIIWKLQDLALKKIHIVTNAQFYNNFKEWLGNFSTNIPIDIINDGTTSNEDRLGAIGDVNFVVSQRKINDDVIVVAGDNLFDFHLQDALALFKKSKHNVIILYDIKDKDLAKHYGVVEIDKNNLITFFEEKPVSPSSTLVSTGIYIFPKKTLELIKKYLAQGNNPDKTGNFLEWLHKREKVYCYVSTKAWYDIGSHEQFEKANKYYKEK